MHRRCVPAWSSLPPTQLPLLSVTCCSAREPPLFLLSVLPSPFLVLTCVGWVLRLHPAQATSPWHSSLRVTFVTTGPGSTHILFWRSDLPVDDMNRFSLVCPRPKPNACQWDTFNDLLAVALQVPCADLQGLCLARGVAWAPPSEPLHVPGFAHVSGSMCQFASCPCRNSGLS